MRVSGASSVAFGSVLALSLVLVRCGGDSGSPAGSGGPANLNAFVGTWSCDIDTTVKVTTPSGTPDQDIPGSLTLTITKSGAASVHVDEDADPPCPLDANVSGTTATLKSQVTCTQGSLSLKVTAVKVTASNGKLTGTRTATVSGKSDDGSTVAGSETTTVDCTKTSGPSDSDGGGTGTTGTGGTSGGGTGGATGATDCSTASDCSTCCSDNFSDGETALDNLLLNCACDTCGTECASSLCKATNPTAPTTGDACDTCTGSALGDTGSCIQPAADKCKVDAGCTAFAKCVATCP